MHTYLSPASPHPLYPVYPAAAQVLHLPPHYPQGHRSSPPDPGPSPTPLAATPPLPGLPAAHWQVLHWPPVQGLIYGAKGVGSQGDGTAQLLCRGPEAQAQVRRGVLAFLIAHEGMWGCPAVPRSTAIVITATCTARIYRLPNG